VERPVKRRALLSLTLAPLLPLLPGLRGPAGAQTITAETAPQYFRLESHPDKDKKGREIVWGYIYNTRGKGNARLRLLVETLDTSGKPVATQIAYVDEDIPLFNRVYYETRVNQPGPSYRVSIHSGDWTRLGGL
jgi:hypothetical protein